MSFLFGSSRRPGRKDVPIEQCAVEVGDAPLYDVVIIGAGTAGSVLANRLSADAARSVLVLERGTYMADTIARIPLLSAARAFQKFYTTAIDTVPQPGFGGRTSSVQVGRMVGGSSAINATVYSRGAHCEFDAWNLDGWRGADLDKYFINSECHYADEKAGQAPAAASRGTSGPWKTRINAPVFAFNDLFLTACDDVGITRTADPHAFGDHLGPVATGAWSTQSSQTPDGSRHHAGFAYLSEDVLRDRSNLKLCVDAGVEKIELEKRGDGKLAVKGVRVSHKGKTYFARARHIIVSSGAVFSPAILQRSGLGPAPLLKSLDIPVLADLPGVGTNLTDHFLVPLHFSGPLQDSAYSMMRGIGALASIARSALTYWRTGRGLFATACTMESMSYFSTSDVEVLTASDVPGASNRIRLRCNDLRRHVPDIELTVSGIWADQKLPEYHGLGARGVICFLVLLVKPEAEGSVEIVSDKEADLPRVDPRYLYTQDGTGDGEDLRALRTGIRVALTVAAHMRYTLGYDIGPACVPGWEPMKGGWDEACLPALTPDGSAAEQKLTAGFDFVDPTRIPDAAIDAFIRQHAFGAQHMASTCAMGPAFKSGSVLDPATLEVHGTQGLSVCDGSIFPRVLSVHPQAAIIATAEKYADELLQSKKV